MEHLIKPTPLKSAFYNGKLKNDIGGGHSAAGESSTYASVLASNMYYEEYEYDRRLKKRRSRLLAAADDAFSQIKRLEEARQKCRFGIQLGILGYLRFKIFLFYDSKTKYLSRYDFKTMGIHIQHLTFQLPLHVNPKLQLGIKPMHMRLLDFSFLGLLDLCRSISESLDNNRGTQWTQSSSTWHCVLSMNALPKRF